MGYWNSGYYFWVDQSGQGCTTQWATQSQSDAVPGGLLTLGAAAQAMSCAKLVAIQYSTTHIIGGVGTSGSYPSVWDRAVLLDKYSGSRYNGQLQIPAPLASIFLSDNVTVDMSSPLVTAFVAQVLANLGDKAGNPVSQVTRGNRSRVRSNPQF